MAATILIADDDAVQRRLVENMVQKCGYEALAVDSGDAAVELLTAPDAQQQQRQRAVELKVFVIATCRFVIESMCQSVTQSREPLPGNLFAPRALHFRSYVQGDAHVNSYRASTADTELYRYAPV